MQCGEWITIGGQQYRLGAVLSAGAGSYGQVWAATTDTGREVALKFINAEAMVQADPSLRGHWRAHLEREISFLAGLDSEQTRHIVALIDHGQIDGQPVLVMERLTTNLGEWLAQQHRKNALVPSLAQVLDWSKQILAGLDVIHHAGFVYRDLKLSNILVDETGTQLKLADFGSLKRQSNDRTQSFIGTLATMAPEQALPVRCGAQGCEYRIDHRADYYALGLLLFGLLTQQPATAAQRRLGLLLAQHGQEGAVRYGDLFGGLNDEERNLLHASIERWITPTASWLNNHSNPAVQLTRLIERLLARDPADRPNNSQEIRQVLEWVQSTPAELPTLAPSAIHFPSTWDSSLPPTAPPTRRRRPHRSCLPLNWAKLRPAVLLTSVLSLSGGVFASFWLLHPELEQAPKSVITPDAVVAPTSVPANSTARQASAQDQPSSATPTAAAPSITNSLPVSSPVRAPAEPTSRLESPAETLSTPAIPESVANNGPSSISSNPSPLAPKPEVTKSLASSTKPEASKPSPALAKPDKPELPKTSAAVLARPDSLKTLELPKAALPVAKSEPSPSAPAPGPTKSEIKSSVARKSEPADAAPSFRPIKATTPATTPLPPVQFVSRPATLTPASPAPGEESIHPDPPLSSRTEESAGERGQPARSLTSSSAPSSKMLPPIRLVSRAEPATAPTVPSPIPRPADYPSSPTPSPRLLTPRPKPSSVPVESPTPEQQPHDAPAPVQIHRNVETFTRWMERTGVEMQRGIENAQNAFYQWSKSGPTEVKIERRDRWAERARP